jgi:hypothetical protein
MGVDHLVGLYADPGGDDTITVLRGDLQLITNDHNRLLFDVMGLRVSRFLPNTPTVQTRACAVVGREVFLAADLQTDTILERWINPANGVAHTEMHSWTDPFQVTIVPSDFQCLDPDLSVKEPEYVHRFEGGVTRFISRRSHGLRLLAATPWAGNGVLLLSLSGRRVDSRSDIPAVLRRAVEQQRPEYLFAPTSWSEPDRSPGAWAMQSAG